MSLHTHTMILRHRKTRRIYLYPYHVLLQRTSQNLTLDLLLKYKTLSKRFPYTVTEIENMNRNHLLRSPRILPCDQHRPHLHLKCQCLMPQRRMLARQQQRNGREGQYIRSMVRFTPSSSGLEKEAAPMCTPSWPRTARCLR